MREKSFSAIFLKYLFTFLQLANPVIIVETVPVPVRLTARLVDTQMVYVPVRQAGWVIIVQKVIIMI